MIFQIKTKKLFWSVNWEKKNKYNEKKIFAEMPIYNIRNYKNNKNFKN